MDVEYTFEMSDVERYTAQCKTMDGLPDPQPPSLTEATTTSLALRWTKSIPFPAGIIQAIEVQYAIAPNPKLVGNSASFEEEKSSFTPASGKSESTPSSPMRWFALISRTFSQAHFEHYKWSGLTPGSHYVLRLRYRSSGTNWSEYSQASAVYSTLADRPRAPIVPTCIPVTSFAVQIIWGPTNQTPVANEASQRRSVLAENGSPVFEYVLVGKSVGEDDFIELYRGPNKTHLELGLFPEIAYTFKLAAVNSIGISDFSQPVSVQTPSRPVRNSSVARSIFVATAAGIDLSLDFGKAICVKEADADKEVIALSGFTPVQIQIARMCREAWREYWDSSSEQTFYFNSILSIRQLEIPAVLRDTSRGVTNSNSSPSRRINPAQSVSTKGGPSADGTTLDANSPEILFRKKRYRLLHALRKKTANFARSKDVVHLELERASMLADCFTAFEKLSALDFRRRVRVSFVGEQGLDSGGLSKEAFLVLTKQAAYYSGPKYHRWVSSVVSTILVPRERARNVAVATTAADVEKEKSTANTSSLNATDTERREEQGQSALVEEQVEGYFLSSKAASEAPIATDAAPKQAGSTEKDRADSGMAEACFQSIIALDTERRISSVQFFKFLGRLLGKAVYDRQLVDFPLSSLLLKHLLGEISEGSAPCSPSTRGDAQATGGMSVKLSSTDTSTLEMLDELRYLDHELHKQLLWMCENDITDVIYETFSVSDGKNEFPLCAHGETKNVTEDNKMEYIRLMIQWKTTYSVAHNLFPFLEAFHEIIPLNMLQKAELTAEELNLVLNGKREVDVEDLRAFCIYQGVDAYFNETHDSVIWFWQSMRAFSQSERRNLLKFFTGSGRVPLDGYDPPLNVTQGHEMTLNSLPRAHTCFNQIVLPKYSCFEVCVKQLRFAMDNTAGFEFA